MTKIQLTIGQKTGIATTTPTQATLFTETHHAVSPVTPDQQFMARAAVTPCSGNRNTEVTTTGSRKFVLKSGAEGIYQPHRGLGLLLVTGGSHKMTTIMILGQSGHGAYGSGTTAVIPPVLTKIKFNWLQAHKVAATGNRNTEVTTTGSRKFVLSSGSRGMYLPATGGAMLSSSNPFPSGILNNPVVF